MCGVPFFSFGGWRGLGLANIWRDVSFAIVFICLQILLYFFCSSIYIFVAAHIGGKIWHGRGKSVLVQKILYLFYKVLGIPKILALPLVMKVSRHVWHIHAPFILQINFQIQRTYWMRDSGKARCHAQKLLQCVTCLYKVLSSTDYPAGVPLVRSVDPEMYRSAEM